jgi:hypothetical protein
VDYRELAENVSAYDFGLLPYPAAKNMKQVSLQSFPSKLAQYLTAGLDIVYVGPKISSIVNFFQANHIDGEFRKIAEESIESEAIYLAIFKFTATEQAQNLYQKYFSQDAFTGNLKEWLASFEQPEPEYLKRSPIKSQETLSIRSAYYIGNKILWSPNIYKYLLIPSKLLNRISKGLRFRATKYIEFICKLSKFRLTQRNLRAGLGLIFDFIRSK